MIGRKSELAISCVWVRHIGDEPWDPRLMVTLMGSIEQYWEVQEEWVQYVERLKQFLQANDIVRETKANKRRSVFLAFFFFYKIVYASSKVTQIAQC